MKLYEYRLAQKAKNGKGIKADKTRLVRLQPVRKAQEDVPWEMPTQTQASMSAEIQETVGR